MNQKYPIQLLDTTLISQIAAGEVIDRPASVVRELVENSLDAGATAIDITIRQGGISEIQIVDNGDGVVPEQLPMALAHHATSKVASFDELQSCTTLGFRGEALASINSVARLKLSSRTAQDQHGWEYSSQMEQPQPVAMAQGTKVVMRDLFFAVPARRKFLRNETTEWRHIYQVVRKLSLVRFECAFKLSHNGRLLLDLPVADSIEQRQNRVVKLTSGEFIDNALIIDSAAGNMQLSGWISLPTFSRSRGDMQYLFVNNRPVRDATIAHAVAHGYRDTLFHQRYPAYVLMLEMEREAVDHNAHPAKQDIRLRSGRLVHDFVASCIADILAKSTKSKTVNLSGRFTHDAVPSWDGQRSRQQQQSSGGTNSKFEHHQSTRHFTPAQSLEGWKQLSLAAQQNQDQQLSNPYLNNQEQSTAQQSASEVADDYPLGYAVGQIHNIYIVAQNSKGMVLVDMHAAHERIVYERLKNSISNGTAKTQKLMFPEVFSLNEQQINSLNAIQHDCEGMGLVYSQIAPKQIRVESVPANVGRFNLKTLIESLADSYLAASDWNKQAPGDKSNYEGDSSMPSQVGDLTELIYDTIASCACKAAIKAGRELSLAEMNSLLRDMERTERNGQCNHGRPTWIQLPTTQLDSLFMRGR